MDVFKHHVVGLDVWISYVKYVILVILRVRRCLPPALSITAISVGWNEINPHTYVIADLRTTDSRENPNKVEV